MYANYVKRTFVQHIEILLYVLTLNPASVLIKMYIPQPMHRFYRPFLSCMMEQLFRSSVHLRSSLLQNASIRYTEHMFITCLDLEGVLVPEIWIAFSEATGIPELRRTTRDEPNYDTLMRYRIDILDKHNLGLNEIRETIKKIDPMPGAKDFLDELRSFTQVLILSDTFEQFAAPLMEKLGRPTIFCNTLEHDASGKITGYKMRCPESKLATVKALQSVGFETIAAGDSFNDLAMIKASKAGFLFKSTEQIIKDNPSLPAYTEYSELLAGIKNAMRP